MFTQDRLSELSRPGKLEVVVDSNEDLAEPDGSLSPEFFEEVGQIRSLTSLIRRNIKAIQQAQNNFSLSADKKSQNDLEELMDSTNSSANKVRIKLKAMKDANDSLPSEDAQKKTRTHIHKILTQKFMALISEYQALQNNFRDKSREKVQKQAEIVKPGISREEVDEMISTGTGIFADQVLNDQKHREAKNALLEIQEQQRDLKQLEKSINELNQLFIDMQNIVESSSESLNRLEENVTKSVSYGGAAVTSVDQALTYTMLRRKRVAMLTTAIIVIFLIAATVIGLILAHKFGLF